MPSLKVLMVDGNQLRSLRYEVIRAGADAIKQALRQKIAPNTPLFARAQQVMCCFHESLVFCFVFI